MKNWSAMELETAFGANGTSSIYGLSAYAHAMEETDSDITTPVKGTRHPSTRADRRIATKKHKKKDAALASDRDYQKAERRSSEKGKTVLPWGKDKWLHSSRVAHSGHLDGGDHRMEEKKALQNWRAEYGDGNVFVRNASTWRYWEDDSSFLYNILVWEEDEELWNQAWSERAEAEYWERREEEDWEDMLAWDQANEFFDEELRSGLARDLSGIDSGIEPEEDTNPSPVGVTNNPYIWEYGVISEGRRFVCEDEESARWLFHRLGAFYQDSTDFSPRLVRK